MARAYLVWQKLSNYLSKLMYCFVFSPAMYESSGCSAAPGDVTVVDWDHYSKCTVVSHCCFNFHIPDHIVHGASFHVLISHLQICFGGVSVTVFSCFLTRLFVFLLLSLKRSLYILDTNLLSDVAFANIFPQSVTYFLILLTLSFTEQRFFHFNEVMPLLLYHHTQGHVGFLLCYLLGVLQFGTLH